MARTEAISAALNRHPQLTRAAGWALASVMAILLGYWLSWLVPYVEWEVGPVGFSSSMLLFGFFYSGALGIALWRAGHAGWWRTAGFAVFSMFWFDFGTNVGIRFLSFLDSSLFDSIMMFATGFLAAGIWLTLVGLLFLPELRRQERSGWPLAALWRLLAAGIVVGTLAGTAGSFLVALLVKALLNSDWWQHPDLIVVPWGAVYAAALSWALPPTRSDGSAD